MKSILFLIFPIVFLSFFQNSIAQNCKENHVVIPVNKERIEPAFGLCFPDDCIILIRNDIPSLGQKFIVLHEVYHFNGKTGFFHEINASFGAMIKQPIGAFIIMYYSVSPDRLKFYLYRMIGKTKKIKVTYAK